MCKILVFPYFLSPAGDATSPARQVLEVVLMREVVPVLVPVLVECYNFHIERYRVVGSQSHRCRRTRTYIWMP